MGHRVEWDFSSVDTEYVEDTNEATIIGDKIKFKIWNSPYVAGERITKANDVTIEPGLTVLVGCNGLGKTTLLNNIKDDCKDNKIPYFCFNNYHDGGKAFIAKEANEGDGFFALKLGFVSEGECIRNVFECIIRDLGKFINTGFSYDFTYFTYESEKSKSNNRVILLDAIDSGLSIDNIVDFKNLFNLVVEDGKKKGLNVYIVISANEYELARKERCLDVASGEYVDINSYEEYRDFILKSRDVKIERIRNK